MYKLDRESTVLLVVDVQTKLAAAMSDEMLDTIVTNIDILATSFHMMGLPVCESLQYPQGLGETLEELSGIIKPHYRFEKREFSCANDEGFNQLLEDEKIKSVVIVGMETHVCVLQTAIDLLQKGYKVHVVSDAVISRNEFNWEIGIDYMQNAGALITVTEVVLFQLLRTSAAKEFKEISNLIK